MRRPRQGVGDCGSAHSCVRNLDGHLPQKHSCPSEGRSRCGRKGKTRCSCHGWDVSWCQVLSGPLRRRSQGHQERARMQNQTLQVLALGMGHAVHVLEASFCSSLIVSTLSCKMRLTALLTIKIKRSGFWGVTVVTPHVTVVSTCQVPPSKSGPCTISQ